jgi:hypothetical protein
MNRDNRDNLSIDMFPYSTLGICIDSDSINSASQTRKETVDRLLVYHNRTSNYDFVRSEYDPSPNVVSKVPVIQYSRSREDEQKLDIIAKNALKKAILTEGERSFLLFIYNYSGMAGSQKNYGNRS